MAFAFCACGGFAQNLIQNGDFTQVKHTGLYPECGTNGGKASLFTEESTWNKCGKLEVDKIMKDKNGNETANAYVWIGGDSSKGGGFAVKPNTVYRFSVEIKGNAADAGVNAVEWIGNDLWKDMRSVKSTVGNIKVQKEWTLYKGTFKTGPNAKRAALGLQLWWNTKYGPQKFKVGDYILFDNVKVEEEKNKIDVPAPAAGKPEAKTIKAAKTSLVVSAPVIDGILDEAVWADASEIKDFVPLKKKEFSAVETSVKLLSDQKNLYLGITCREPLAVNDSVRTDSSAVWNGDVMEIFFGPKNGDRILSQFVVGAGGGRYASHGAAEVRNYDKWEAKTAKDVNGWHAEVRIPFSELGWNSPAETGEMIAFNVCRQRKKAGELLTWSPVKQSFHEVGNFGTLVLNDYAAGLNKKYHLKVSGIDRSAFEKLSAETEAALLKAKYERNAKRRFSAAPVSVTADFAVPFVPDEIFNPVESIHLKAAVNEFKPLPLAIANLTDKIAEYRVVLETAEGYNGGYGLKGFPEKQITLRKAVRFKDSDQDAGSLRLDPLPKMDQACTVTIPPKEAGLVWFDFNTEDVKPGMYQGRIRIIPLSEPAKWESVNGGFHNRKYTGGMLDIPVTLEVRNIILSRHPALPAGFFQNAENENMFRLMAEIGVSDFGILPWSFMFKLDKDGNIDPAGYQAPTQKMIKNLREHQEWGRKYGIHPTYFIGFSAYRTFQSLYNAKNNPARSAKLWPQWISAVKKLMNDNGVSDQDFAIETWDEPDPKLLDELIATHAAAKKAAPTARLLLTLGAHIMSAADMEKLAPHTDEWVLWSYGYFERPEHRDFIRRALASGKKIRHYTCSTSMRAHLDRNYRKNAWFGEYHKLNGNMMFWFSDCYGGYGASDWKVAMGGGIAYRSFDEFMPSIRYMAMRQGMTDVKYLAKLREVAGNSPDAQKFLADAPKRVVIDFGHDPSMPDKVREEAAELILKLQKSQ